jgi:hypothetical protein
MSPDDLRSQPALPRKKARVWTESTEGLHSYSSVLSQLSDAIAKVSERIHVPANARVVQWTHAVKRLSQVERRAVLEEMLPHVQRGSWNHPYKDAFRALVDARTFTIIVQNLLAHLTDADLRDLISGNFDPALDKPDSRARDRDFELFIGAIARRAGLPIRLFEPDLILTVQGEEVSVAAKRLSSRRKVGDNIDKAARQILKAERPGFIFLDVTRILDPTYSVVTHWRHADQTVGSPLMHFVEREYALTLRRRRNEYVRGVVLRASLPHVSKGFQYGTHESWWPLTVDGVDALHVNSLLHQLLSGLAGS